MKALRPLQSYETNQHITFNDAFERDNGSCAKARVSWSLDPSS